MEKGNEIIDDLEIKPTEPEKKTEPDKKTTVPSLIAIDENGLVAAKNNSELLRYCGAIIQSGMVPKHLDKPEKLFGALMFVRSLGLPDTAIRQTAVIHGTPSIYGDLPLALAQSSKEMAYFEEQFFDKDYNFIRFENKNLNAEVYGAVCFIKRKNNDGSTHGDPQSFAYTLDDARNSDLYPAKNSSMPWSKYTKLMLRYKARALGLKSVFADKMNGVSVAEWDHETTNPSEFKDVTPEKELANELNKI
jgi:hypothetical protein